MLVDHGLELLETEESLALLAGGEVGRIGITVGALPAIYPVNYAFIDGSIVFPAVPGSRLFAASADSVVAFEVDDFDTETRTGWSVLAIGIARVVNDLDAAFEVLADKLEPFSDGRHKAILRISPELITGRRIVHEV